MRVKESLYTFKTDDGEGGLLLYNTAIGTNSFCHLNSTSVEKYYKLLSTSSIDNKIPRELINKGILVPIDRDEKALLKNLYIQSVGNSVLTLIINPTEECNFRCKYCYEDFPNNYLSEETVNRIIHFVEMNLKHYTGLRVMWFGGEPLLGMPAIRHLSKAFISICKKARKPFSAQITTNGYLLTYETFVELVKCGVCSFQITVDGIKEIHDSQRIHKSGKGTYEIILRNLLAIRDGRKYPAQIVLRTNFTIKLYHQLDDYINNFCNLFVDDKRFAIDIHLVGNWLGRADHALIEDIAEVDAYRMIYSAVLKHPIGIRNLTTMFMNPEGCVCVAAKRNSFLISSNGDIHKCTLIFETPGSKVGEIPITSEPMNIDESKTAKWIGEFNYCDKVENCSIAPLCFGDHCPLARVTGERKKGDMCCPGLKSYLDLYLKCIHRFQPFDSIEIC